jgi:uncharacterized protein (DUF58 family)
MGLRSRFQAWFESRIALRDHTLLTQRNIYILPTWPGFMLAITLLVLLVTSINYQLNLGYVLTFMITGCAVVGMHVCHGTLRGLSMHLNAPEPVFAGSSVTLGINLTCNRSSTRYGIGIGVLGTGHWAWTDVPALGSAVVHVTFTPPKRGLHHIPTLTAETRYPLGTFRVWTVWRAAAQVLVYPKPELHPPPLPPGTPMGAGTASTQQQNSGEYDGVRAYRRGDTRKQIVWKKAAKAQELVSRDTQQVQRFELWLDLERTGLPAGHNLERQLERLCAWVVLAEKHGLQYGLRLGQREVTPSSGQAHMRNCLQALTLH